MSYKYKLFTVELTLQHISMVKTCEKLWKQSDICDKIKKFFDDEIQIDSNLPWESLEIRSRQITSVVIGNIDTLMLPCGIKNYLRCYSVEMGIGMFRWLRDTLLDMIVNNHENYREKISNFVANIFWNDIGCVDGKKILESYVSTRETIDYDTWSQLCYYCCGNYIEKFSQSIDWDNCNRINSTFSVFWYHKIYGNFPKGEMFSSSVDKLKFNLEYELGNYEENYIKKTLFIESIIEKNISAVEYFGNQLNTDEKLEIILKRVNGIFLQFDNDYSQVFIYLFGEIDDEGLRNLLRNYQQGLEVMFVREWPWILMNWPWISCIHSWSYICEPLKSDCNYFYNILRKIRFKLDEEDAIDVIYKDNEEFGRRCSNIFRKNYCEIFEEVWKNLFLKNSYAFST